MDVGSSATKRSLLDLDPDYKDGHISETKRRCLVEESGQEQAQQRAVEMVVRVLDAALAQKESEALQLQERVHACQRDLHLLRFGITSSYFRSFDAPGTSVRNEEQNAVHPSVLRLMGISLPSGPKTRGVRYKSVTQGTSQEAVDGVPTGKISKEYEENVTRKEHDENQEEKNESAPIKVPRYVPPNLPKPPEVCAASVRMERHRLKRRLVVGNVSKWLPEDLRESAATHKWMLYLRGPKDSPDVSDIVAKVRYFLHPSYQPHDIVDVVHPFYLARRGWGEFPVRVQVHFTLQGNRPIDIIHNLKLDRTYSGLQTLGGETVVDVWLKHVSSMEDSCQVSGMNQEESQDTLSESCNSDIDWHQTVAHENLEMMIANTRVKVEQEEEGEDQKSDEIEIKEENEGEKEEDEEEYDEEEEEEVVEDDEEEEEDEIYDDEEEGEEKGGIQEDSKENIKDNFLHLTSSQKHDLETFQEMTAVLNVDDIMEEIVSRHNRKTPFGKFKNSIKSEPGEIQNNTNNSIGVLMAETNKTEKGFVLHTLPDHDYLGSETFTLKCTMCVKQNKSDGIIGKNPLKPEMIQVTNQCEEPSWSTLLPPPLVLIQKSQVKSQTFPLNTVVLSDHRQTTMKKEEIQDATNLDCVLSVPRNGFAKNLSLVQCVDTEGNLFYIRLEKPVKYGVQKGILNSSMDVQMQHPTGGSIVNHLLNSSLEGKAVIKNNIVLQKNKGLLPSTTLQTGRSLLKKNCVASLPFVPSNINRTTGSDKNIELRPAVLGLSQSHLKEEHEEIATQLIGAEQQVSRIANDQQAVIWVLKQLPLVDVRVNDRKFRRHHPYCAQSVDVFLSWPVGKRHCAERLRANAVYAILQTSDSSRFAKWSVRHIIKWSRLHALTPLPSLMKEHKDVQSVPAINYSLSSTLTEPYEVQDWLENIAETSKTAEEIEIVDVDSLIPPSSDTKISPCSEETSNAIMCMHSDTFFGDFLRDATAQLDIKLKPEMLCPNVMYPAAEELLNRACQSLCEDLLRRSLCQAWSHCKKLPTEIVLNDVQNAILSRPEFSVFTNDGLGVQAYDPFIDRILRSYS